MKNGLHIYKAKDGWRAKIVKQGRNIIGTCEGYKNKTHCFDMVNKYFGRWTYKHMYIEGLKVA